MVIGVLLDIDEAARDAIEVAPSLILEGDTPRLLDEWQTAPQLWNYVRRSVDERQTPGQFILTGSAVPDDDINRHTGAGRFSFLRMRPMSLYESGNSAGTVSLASLLADEDQQAVDPGLEVTDLIEFVVRGGWPAQQQSAITAAAQSARDYLQQIQEVDVGRVGGVRKDPTINRPHFTNTDRKILALLGSAMSRARRRNAFVIVKPETVFRWHKQRIRKHWTHPPNKPRGRPPTNPQTLNRGTHRAVVVVRFAGTVGDQYRADRVARRR